MAMKHDLENLDAGQLEFMWSMMRLRKGGATKNDVQALKGYIDAIRQALIQKTGGEQTQSSSAAVPFSDVGTYINMMISAAKLILAHNIVQNNALELSPHDIDIWAQGGVLPVYKDTKMDEGEHNNV